MQTETGGPDGCGRTDGQRRERPEGRAGGVLRERGGPGTADWLRASGAGPGGMGCWGGLGLGLRAEPWGPTLPPRCVGASRTAVGLHGPAWEGSPEKGGQDLRVSGRGSLPCSQSDSVSRGPGRGQVLACASPSCPAPGPRFRRPGADGRRPASLPAPGRVCSDGRGSQSWRGRGKPAPAGDLP